MSHLYLSPSLQARHGSSHGYDVVDPTQHLRRSRRRGGVPRALRGGARCRSRDRARHRPEPHGDLRGGEPVLGRQGECARSSSTGTRRRGWYRRFFDVGELGGVRVEDPEVFEVTHAKVLQLVADGLVDGLRIDHPDGLANPREYLERLRDRGVAHVWVEKILEPGEPLRDWPVEGTTGYEFANDVDCALRRPAGEEPMTELYAELTGERRTFAEIAHEAKLEVARTTFAQEFERLRALIRTTGSRRRSRRCTSTARTSSRRPAASTTRTGGAAAPLPAELRRVVLLEGERSPQLDEFVVALPADDGAGDGEGRRGHGVLPVFPADGAERGRRRPGPILDLRRRVSRCCARAARASSAAAARVADARHEARAATCARASARSQACTSAGPSTCDAGAR